MTRPRSSKVAKVSQLESNCNNVVIYHMKIDANYTNNINKKGIFKYFQVYAYLALFVTVVAVFCLCAESSEIFYENICPGGDSTNITEITTTSTASSGSCSIIDLHGNFSVNH